MKQTDFKFRLFGGEIRVIIYDAEEFILEEIMREFYKEALRLQKTFNFFDSESELSKLNSNGKLNASNELIEVIKKALELSELTKGKYDITLGKKILQRKKSEEESEIPGNFRDVSINGNEIFLKKKDLMVDLGSIAKGYITDRLADFLSDAGVENFIIDSRGDIVAKGNYEHIIEIQNPRHKDKEIAKISLRNQAIATSGDYYQEFKGGSHILNQKDLISVSVVAKTLGEADAYATAIFVSDEKTIEEMLEKNKKIKAFTIDKNLNEKRYNNFEKVIKYE